MSRRTGLRKRQKKKGGLGGILVLILVGGVLGGWQLVGDVTPIMLVRQIIATDSSLSGGDEIVRGTLYDRNYKEVAVSMERVSVFARSRELQAVDETVDSLATVLGVKAEAIHKMLLAGESRIWLGRNISQEQEEEIKALNLDGIYLHREHSRYYPQQLVAAHLVGFVQDDSGLTGVEFYYDKLVQKMLTEEQEGQRWRSSGQHVLLTLDLKIQHILEDLVETIVADRPDVKVGAYAMDAGTGAVIASVQFPSFNPNTYRKYSQELLENMLVQPMLLPPTFRGLLRDSAFIQYQFENRGYIQPWSIGVEKVNLGSQLRLWENSGLKSGAPQDFGNNDGSLELPTGFYIVERTKGPDFTTVPETASPLALLTSLSSLVNGGKKIRPYVAQAVIDAESWDEFQLHNEKNDFSAETVVSTEVSNEISRLLVASGKKDDFGGVTLKDSIHVSTSSTDGFGYRNNEVYFSAVPAHRAGLSLLVTIQGGTRSVRTKQYKKTADPGEVIAAALPRLTVLQQVGKSIAVVAEPEDGENINYPVELDKLRQAVKESLEENLAGAMAEPGEMPSLVGLSLRKSLRLLQDKQCQLRIFGTGRVVEQTPAAGTSLQGIEECVIRLQRQDDVSLETLEEKLSDK